MKKLTDLFKTLEITRSMPQTGYAVSGMPQHLLSNLAEHHYLVTFMAWQLAEWANQKGAQLDTGKVMQCCLVHDLGELLGGDISMPYAEANPKARTLAKAFEQENREYLATLFPDGGETFLNLHDDMSKRATDEAVIAKIADYIEVTHYKFYNKQLLESDLTMIERRLLDMVNKLKDASAKSALQAFVQGWVKELPDGDTQSAILKK